ncbi:hypothetical protein AJ78_01567 [Emergomyces pasteurianus Ep9510]|uniref:Uncharacterized protein n=1 Tax=Emergomyces pasteurianus Ep9510 TaxID=1447872 RepID=A0A1J9QDV3_9EURO|nr:hypothetical protein AJ78_01567 [Emergomyces pasteurianus Ep9510]
MLSKRCTLSTVVTRLKMAVFAAAFGLYKAPRRDAFNQVRANMNVNVLIESDDTLNLYRDSGRVLWTLIDNE